MFQNPASSSNFIIVPVPNPNPEDPGGGLDGTPGNDVISGTSQNDLINGLAGNDAILGNEGDDILNGDSGNDILSGNSGNDFLNGGSGNDSMRGGTGNDIYVVDSRSDRISESSNQGFDQIRSSVTWRLGSNQEQLNLTGTANINGYGNSSRNIINGNQGRNFIDGGSGNDTLNGGSGNDTLNDDDGNNNLDGGSGNDLLKGGSGADLLKGGSGNDLLEGGFNADFSNDTLIGGLGDDTLIGTKRFTDSSEENSESGERDFLTSGNFTDSDLFILGDSLDRTFVYYSDKGSIDYAIITDFDIYNFAGDVSDRIQLAGSSQDYQLSDVSISGISETGIFWSATNDLIGIVQGINVSNFNLNDSNQFTYVQPIIFRTI